MTINAATQWEIRDDPTNGNGSGGFWNKVPGTSVDYSQFQRHQFEFTVSATVSTSTLTRTAGDLFTSAMVGNVIHITAGTGFTAGFYEIITFNSSTEIVVDRACATLGSTGGAAYVGGAFKFSQQAAFDTSFWTTALPAGVSMGNTIWLRKGTHYLNLNDISLVNKAGTAYASYNMVGYKSKRLNTQLTGLIYDTGNVNHITTSLPTFAADMTGYTIYIHEARSTNSIGPNWTAGFYTIVTFNNSTDVTLNAAPATATTASGEGTIMGGYLPYGDVPTDSDRPLLTSTSTFRLTTGAYWNLKNIRTNFKGLPALTLGSNNTAVNCNFINSVTGAVGHAVALGGTCTLAGCEASTTGTATSSTVNITSGTNSIIDCYLHDSDTGIICSNNTNIINSVIDTCATGVKMGASVGTNVINNTIYNCSVAGISGYGAGYFNLFNNIIDSCNIGLIKSSSSIYYNINFNCWHNNGADIYGKTIDFAHPTGGSTTLTSSTFGFYYNAGTSSMVGSKIVIESGVNFIPQTYTITVVAGPTQVTVNPAFPGGVGSAGVGYLLNEDLTHSIPAKGINDISAALLDPVLNSITGPAAGDFSINSSSVCAGTGVDAKNYTSATV